MFDHILKWSLLLGRPQKRAVQMLFDVALILACFVLAMALRLDSWNFLTQPRVWDVLVIVIPATLFVFARVGLYRAVIRFISSRAIRVIILSTGFSGILMFVSNLALGHLIPRSVPIIYIVLLFCAISGSRFAVRYVVTSMLGKPAGKVVIYGAGDAGRQLLNALNSERQYQVMAFIDDNTLMHGREVDTIPIMPASALAGLKEKYGLQTVLLAAPSATVAERRRIISIVESHALQIRTIPSIKEILSGQARVSDLADVQIEELLARETVAPISELKALTVAGRNVLVTGAGGSIGGELCRQIIMMKPKSVVLYEISEYALYHIHAELLEKCADNNFEVPILPILGSVRNGHHLSRVLSSFDVETIFHAAAYKHVPLVEQNIIEGVQNNILGTQTLIEAAIDAGVQTFTLISTDKAVRPTNYMGATKRIAELVCQAYADQQTSTRISIVRFGNVLWSSGSVLPRFKAQIRAGGPVTVTHPDITRYFMTIPEAAQLVMQAGAMARGGEVFVLDMGKPVKILDLAMSMIRLHGMTPYLYTDDQDAKGDIPIVFSGLRPGEKLFEELLVDGRVRGTAHPRIMCADETMLDMHQIASLLKRLKEACDDIKTEAVREIIMDALAEFQPNSGSTDLLATASAASTEKKGLDKVVNIKRKQQRN